jgi:hypothetical protein
VKDVAHRFKENNFRYWQDYQSKVSIPSGIDFFVKGELGNGMVIIAADGYGMQGSYGNGSLFVHRDTLQYADKSSVEIDGSKVR